MLTGLEIALLAVVLVLIAGAATIVNAVKPFLLNAAVGLLALVVAEALFGIEVALTVLALLVVAVGGLPGAVLVILLSTFGVAFVP